MLEREIVKDILLALRERGLWCEKMHGGPYQAAGIPDIIGCIITRQSGFYKPTGQMFGLEVKRPGKKPTAIQLKVMAEMAAAGAITGVVYSVHDALRLLDL